MHGIITIKTLNDQAAGARAILERHAAAGDRTAAEGLAVSQRLQDTVAARKDVHVSPAYTKALRRGEVFPN